MGSNARDLFAFISSTSFVVGAYGHETYALQIYSIDPEMTTQMHDGTVESIHIATLQFPPVTARCSSKGWFLDESNSGALGTNSPFRPSRSPSILAVKRVYSHPIHPRNPITYVFIVPARVFQDEIARYKTRWLESGEKSGYGPRVLPWDAWGPVMTRCIDISSDILVSPRASITCHGPRLLVHDERETAILDFNTCDIARDLHRWRQGSGANVNNHVEDADEVDGGAIQIEPYPGTLVLRPTEVRRGFFAQDVVTCLPYRRTVVEWVGKRPFRIIDGTPSLCAVGDQIGRAHV